jgi:hypothetical protein
MSPARSAPPRAPALRGRSWLNTGGRELRLDDLRGRVVLLHFWTAGSAASLGVLDAVTALDARLPELVVLGVHTPAYPHEGEPGVLAAAVERYGIDHPVLDDADWDTYTAYEVSSHPTFVLVDPSGGRLAHMTGACHAPGLEATIERVLREQRDRGALRRAPEQPGPTPGTAAARAGPARAGPARAGPARAGPDAPLRFPAKAASLPGGDILVADAANARLVLLSPDLGTEVGRIGTGAPGHVDGGPAEARFTAPQGLAVLPEPVAAAVGYDVVVADPRGHALRGVRLADGSVRTLAGGPGRPPIPAPADVAWFDGYVAVAMAAAHQLYAFVPAVDPARQTLGVLAGTGYEGLVDGAGPEAWFAQPSGLSTAADGGTLWVADARTSALRWLRHSPLGGYEVGTSVGRGLFDYGFSDGPRLDAMLQHPLGVTALPDGSVAVADTYNGAVRRYDPRTGDVTTLAGSLTEPGDVVATGDGLVVVETGAHRLVRVPDPPDGGRHVRRAVPRTRRPIFDLAPGEVHVEVRFRTAEGNDAGNGATWLSLATEPAGLLERGLGAAPGLERRVLLPDPADGGYEGGVVHVVAGAGPGLEQDWGLPVRVVPGGASRIVLDLRHP